MQPVSSIHLSQSLNQALGSHLTPTLSSRPTFHEGTYRLTDSPPTIIDPNGTARSTQAVAGSSHSPIHEFTVPLTNDGPATNGLKRKHTDSVNPMANGQVGKRRREGEEMGDFDSDSVHGSKHWTEEEKTKLFTWLMGPGEDEHWNALRTTKNSCFREVCICHIKGLSFFLSARSVPLKCSVARKHTRLSRVATNAISIYLSRSMPLRCFTLTRATGLSHQSMKVIGCENMNAAYN
jgi:hypothetical protein